MAKVLDAGRARGDQQRTGEEQRFHRLHLTRRIATGKHLALAAILLLTPSLAAAQRFDFRAGPPAPGVIRVAPDTPYRPGAYGYEPGRRPDAALFSVAVPEGTYRVTVTLGDATRATRTAIKAESRRLMLLDVATRAGEFVTRNFLVPVRTPALAPPPASAPGGDAVRLAPGERDWYDWDDRLTLEVFGPGLASLSVEPTTAPTIHLAGDSTVTDQPYEPAASWGQMLPALLDGSIAAANHAHSGETLKSFLTALRFDKLLAGVRPGDWLLIQFGHNDQKQQWPQTYADAAGTYPAYLKAYVAEARRRGAQPVLVTPPQRLNYRDGRIIGSLDDYAAAVRRVGADERVPVIDLNAATRAIYEALGPDRAARAFNDGGRDRTHNNNYGAWLLANAVARQLAASVPALAAHIAPAARAFDPMRPPLPDTVPLPASLARSPARPAGS